MKTIIVTRHAGAVEWLRRVHPELADNASQLAHLTDTEIAGIEPGDRVIGVVPIQLAARICARGARLGVIDIELPPEARGRELSADDMAAFGAVVRWYRITEEGAGS